MFKKYKLLKFYVDTIKKHIGDIREHFLTTNNTYQIIDIKYDKAYRVYTVLNFPPNTAENIQKYGYRYLDNETRKFLADLNNQFQKYGLLELIGLSKADQLSETSVHIVVEFKLLKTTKILKNIRIAIISTILTLVTFFSIYFLK